jgi:RHS repeat-associated protein
MPVSTTTPNPTNISHSTTGPGMADAAIGNTRPAYIHEGTAINKVQETHYYPFGHHISPLSNQPINLGTERNNAFLYNGKEFNDDMGLNWYDYGARFYDAQIARFHSVDPHAEVYSYQSPFAYAANNPIYYIDYMGLGPKEWWESIRGWFRDKILNQTPTAGLQRVKPAKEEREVTLDKQYNFFPPLTLSSDNRWGNEVAHNSTFDHSYKSYVKQQGATIHGQSPFSWGVSDDVYSTTIFQDRIIGNKKRMLIQIDNPDIAMVSSRIRRFVGINLKNRIYIRTNGRYRQFPGVYQYTPDELDFMRKNNIPIEENPHSYASASFSL